MESPKIPGEINLIEDNAEAEAAQLENLRELDKLELLSTTSRSIPGEFVNKVSGDPYAQFSRGPKNL